MKNVLVKGYFLKNLGDDLFFKILTEKYPDVNFYCDVTLGFFPGFLKKTKNFVVPFQTRVFEPLFSIAMSKTTGKKTHEFVERNRWRVYIRLNRNFNIEFTARMFLTGSVFAQNCYEKVSDFNNPLKLECTELDDKTFSLKRNKTPNILAGANVGPVYDKKFLYQIKEMLEEYDDVCFRDKASYNLYSFMPNVRYAPDIVFNLDTASYIGEQKKEIIINIINLSRDNLVVNNPSICYKKTAEIAKEYLNKGYKVNLVSFCKEEGDEIAVNCIKHYLGKNKNIKEYFYNGNNMDSILSLFGQCEYVIAGRFHAMILSMLFEKPFLPVCYNDKMFNYLDDVNFKGKITSVRDLHKLDFETADYNLKNNIVVDIQEQVKYAPNQFSALEKYIKSSEV